MEEGYNTMVLDLYFEIMKKSTFSILQMGKFGGCNTSILHLLCSPCLPLSIIAPCTYIHIKDKEN
jgi:hypothetical protein